MEVAMTVRVACCAVQKPHGYHLDLFVLAILIFVCSLLGLPWFVAATVQAISHVRSLLRESDVKIPGEKPQIVGIRCAIRYDILFALKN